MALDSTPIFLFENYCDRSGVSVSVSTGTIATTSDVDNVLDPRLGKKAVFQSATAHAIDIDLGEALSVGTVAVIGTNLASSAGDSGVVKLTMDDDSASFASATLSETSYDSQSVDTWTNRGDVRNLFVKWYDAAISARYVRIELAATTGWAVEVARVVVGPVGWQAAQGGVRWGGYALGALDPTENRLSEADATMRHARKVQRFVPYSFGELSDADALDTLIPNLYAVGGKTDFLSTYNPNATTPARVQITTIWGYATDLEQPRDDNYGSWSGGFTHMERMGQ